MKVPNCKCLIEIAGLQYPVIGFYDADDASLFEPLISPCEGKWDRYAKIPAT